MSILEERRLKIDGINCLIRHGGVAKNKEAVLLLHGNPGPSDDWLGVMPQIAEFSYVIAPDMPGYGRSDRPRGFAYTVQAYADFLQRIIEEMGLEKVHLVLHDFGGAWGLTWAGDHPDALASLSLVNIGVAPGYRWHKFARIWRTPILGELFQLASTRTVLRQALNADNPKPFPDEFIDRIARYSDWGQKRAALRLYRSTSDFSSMAREITEKLGSLKVPANVIWGDSDPYVPASYAAEQRRVFDVKNTYIMPGCGHWPMIDEPEQFAELLLPFLAEQCCCNSDMQLGAAHEG